MLKPLLAHNSSVSLIFEDPVGVPLLHTDESKVSQILRNFISNALEVHREGRGSRLRRVPGPTAW